MAIRNGSGTQVDYDVEEPTPATVPLMLCTAASGGSALALTAFFMGGPRWLLGLALVFSLAAVVAGLRGLLPRGATRMAVRSGTSRATLKPGDEHPVDFDLGTRARFFATGTNTQVATSPLVEKVGQAIEFRESPPPASPQFFAVVDPP